MNTLKAIKVLPFAFAIHNIEEAWAIYTTSHFYRNPFVANTAQFIIAVSLFTALGFVVVFGKTWYRNKRDYQYVMTGFSGMLFLNVFFPHLFSALYLQSYTPGIISALLIILPLTGFILWRFFQTKSFSNKEFVFTILLGGLAGIILVTTFLGIGYVLT